MSEGFGLVVVVGVEDLKPKARGREVQRTSTCRKIGVCAGCLESRRNVRCRDCPQAREVLYQWFIFLFSTGFRRFGLLRLFFGTRFG